jgi:hypothetical protein
MIPELIRIVSEPTKQKTPLLELLDFSELKFKELDEMVDIF